MSDTTPLKDGSASMESMQSTAFETLEKDFQEVLTELIGDKSLEKFRKEYEKLHKALKNSHDQEKKLIKRCRELNSEIVNNAQKVQMALKLSQDDQHTIQQLRKEITKAWKMVDASHEKQARAKETIQRLTLEISNLTRLVEQGAGLSLGHDNTVQELLKVREDLKKEVDEKNEQITSMKDLQNELNGKIVELENEIDEKNRVVKEQKDEIMQKNAEHEREARRKERLDKELKDLKHQLESKQLEFDRSSTELDDAQGEIKRLNIQLKDARQSFSKQVQGMDQLYKKTEKLADDLDKQIKINHEATKNLHKVESVSARKDHTIQSLTNDIQAKNRTIDKHKKETQIVKEKLGKVKKEKNVLLEKLNDKDKEIEAGHRREEASEKMNTVIKREIDVKEKLIRKETEKYKGSLEDIEILKRQLRSVESDIQDYIDEQHKTRKIIHSLEKEREKLAAEAADNAKKHVKSLDSVKLKEMEITEMKKKIAEGEHKLKEQNALYEKVRSDKNLYSKNLIEAQDEIAEMKRKFKIMHHQIEQLKEEITAKATALVTENLKHKADLKIAEQAQQETQSVQKLCADHERTIHSQNNEIKKLAKMLTKFDETAIQQRNEFEQILAERDILGTQLIRRNDELALVYEKSTLKKGEAQYSERMQDIRILRLKIGDLTRKLDVTKRRLGNIDELKSEVYRLQHDLLQEKTKVKALSEELENPMNVHRWRKLEGSDPATYEMIQKIQTLQKRLIAKTEEVVEKNLKIQEQEKLYLELKNILARQPGPEVAEQLSVYQQNLKEKTRQMKAMASELNMYQAQVNEYKYERERLKRDLEKAKRKYFEMKRRNKNGGMGGRVKYIDATTGQILTGTELQRYQQQVASSSYGARFTGGGFNLAG
eukprot:g3143.t1